MNFKSHNILNVDPMTVESMFDLLSDYDPEIVNNRIMIKIVRRHLNKVYHRTRAGEMQNWRCAICEDMTDFNSKKKFPTAEHIVPKSQGGINHVDNFLVTCYDCNNKRGVEDIFSFYEKNKKLKTR